MDVGTYKEKIQLTNEQSSSSLIIRRNEFQIN